VTAILIDTHIYVWARLRPQRLTARERLILDAGPIRQVSVVVLWEIAILQGLGRIEDDPNLLELPVEFDLLPIRPAHCKKLRELPSHHRDPFDRMLLAQAHSEQVPLLTRDQAMAAYHGHVTILP
jgi:PIN domain nuclease of toxin-antitoxin system